MIIADETKLRNLLNMQTIDTDVLAKISQKICIDLSYLIETINDNKMVRYASDILEKIQECLEEEICTSVYVDNKHLDNYYCRNTEIILNEIQLSNSSDYRINELWQEFDSYVNNIRGIRNVYLDILLVRNTLPDCYNMSKSDINFLLTICSNICANQPENVLCNEVLKVIKVILKVKLQQLLVNVENKSSINKQRIDEIKKNIDDIRST